MKKLTVITVTFNCEDTILATINSVLMQKSIEYIEYIIIDGGSSDNTVAVARTKEGILINSEPDEGIYDAMNKGVSLSTSPYCIFLNSGDVLANEFVASDVIKLISDNPGKIILGHHGVIGREAEFQPNISKIISRAYMNFSHQAIVMPHSLLKKYPFDIKYKLASDFDQLMRALTDSDVEYYRRNISWISAGGVSDIRRIHVLREWISISGFKPIHIFFWFIYCLAIIKKKIWSKIFH
jgi:glycosyltransferase involved in cell wall biosynthesis